MVNCIYTTNNSLKSLLCSLDSSEVELSISGSIIWSVVSCHYVVWHRLSNCTIAVCLRFRKDH
jgi:hypothetical protein